MEDFMWLHLIMLIVGTMIVLIRVLFDPTWGMINKLSHLRRPACGFREWRWRLQRLSSGDTTAEGVNEFHAIRMQMPANYFEPIVAVTTTEIRQTVTATMMGDYAQAGNHS